MPPFLVDENLPRSLAPSLRSAGFDVADVRDHGLRGRPDNEVLGLSITRDWPLITADLGFGSRLRALPSFPGVLFIRLPDEWPTWRVNEWIKKALMTLESRDLTRTVVTVEPKRLRVHQVG